MAGNISLTKMLFIGLISTFLIGTLFGVYSSYLSLNNATIEEPYNTAFQDIAAQYSDFGGIATTASNQSVVKNILDFGKNAITGTVNVFVVGLDAIGSMFSMIPLIGNVFSIVGSVIPGLNGVLGLLLIIIGLYIAMRYIQSTSNKTDLP